MFRVLDIYIIQDFSLWFYYFLGVAFNFTMNHKNREYRNGALYLLQRGSGSMRILHPKALTYMRKFNRL